MRLRATDPTWDYDQHIKHYYERAMREAFARLDRLECIPNKTQEDLDCIQYLQEWIDEHKGYCDIKYRDDWCDEE